MFNPRHLAEKEIDITIKMFRMIRRQRKQFELFISPVTILEILKSPSWLLPQIVRFMESLEFIEISENEDADKLTNIYVKQGVLNIKNIDDLTHIAYATVARCDYIVSWNFKHFVNINTIERVKLVNEANNYKNVSIISPFYFTGEK
jgi:predicted nucleic acid-binding protein